MTLMRTSIVTGIFLLVSPIVVAAQSDPTSPTVMAPSSGAQPGSNGSSNSQATPGIPRQTANHQNSTFTSEPGGGSAESDAQRMQDKTFLKNAALGGLVEVAAGQLASQKADNEKVKAFGQKMVTDHTLLSNDLKPFADRMSVPPPAKPKAADQAELDRLRGLSGEDFDKEYVSFMMKDHGDDLKEFNQELGQTGDSDLRAAVGKGQQMIAQHKRMIDKIGSSLGVSAAK